MTRAEAPETDTRPTALSAVAEGATAALRGAWKAAAVASEAMAMMSFIFTRGKCWSLELVGRG